MENMTAPGDLTGLSGTQEITEPNCRKHVRPTRTWNGPPLRRHRATFKGPKPQRRFLIYIYTQRN